MPLRDHFRPPLDDFTSWDLFHGQWPAMIVMSLERSLPPRYYAGPRVHVGTVAEIDIGTFEEKHAMGASWSPRNGNGGAATAVLAPSEPTLSITTDFPDLPEYEVRVFDKDRGRRLVAAIEIVSPANKDRPEHRRAFVAKCAALLQQRVSVTIVDVVTIRNFNLYADLLDLIGQSDPGLQPAPPATYAAAIRSINAEDRWRLDIWSHALVVGQPLPTLPLWLDDALHVPLELEKCYEETCRVLRIP